jgi:hypothetical protein
MYCYAVYCTSIFINRYTRVHMMLTHAHPAPHHTRQPANRSRPQHRQTKTKHAHTQYTQSTVHSQFESPPGGESMYSSPHVYVRNSMTFISRLPHSYKGQNKCRSSYTYVFLPGVESPSYQVNVCNSNSSSITSSRSYTVQIKNRSLNYFALIPGDEWILYRLDNTAQFMQKCLRNYLFLSVAEYAILLTR